MISEKTARNQRSNADPGPNTISYPGVPTVLVPKNTDAPADRRTRGKSPAPAAPLTGDEQRVLSRGIAFLMACAAALSAPTLFGLALLIGFAAQLAWLLPAALDGYAVTSIWFGRKVPASHPAAKAARRNARLALALTVACNGLYHLLTLGGVLVPTAARVTLLVAVSSLPPFLVDRLLHLRSLAGGNSAPTAVTDQASIVQPKAQPSKNNVGERPGTDAVTVQPSTAAPGEIVHANGHATVQAPRPSTARVDDAPLTTPSTAEQDELIVHIGRTVYESVKTALGKRPTEGAFRDALAEAAAPHVAAGRLPETYRDPSVSTAKRLRKQVEDRFPELSPLHLIREAS